MKLLRSSPLCNDNTIKTRMTTSIGSEALLPLEPDRKNDGKNICRIDANIQEECAHTK